MLKKIDLKYLKDNASFTPIHTIGSKLNEVINNVPEFIIKDTFAEILPLAVGDKPLILFVNTDETNDDLPTQYLYHPNNGVYWIPTVLI